MNESELPLLLNVEEHELISYALDHVLSVIEEIYLIHEENEKSLMLKNLREKSLQLWISRFIVD